MACIKIIHIINNVYVFLYYTGLLQEVANPGQYFPLALTNDRDRTNPLAQLRAAQPAGIPRSEALCEDPRELRETHAKTHSCFSRRSIFSG